MSRRFLLVPCVLVFLIAGGVAVVAYRAASVQFTAFCVFRIDLPPTTLGDNPSALDFLGRMAATEVHQVSRSDVYSGPAAAEGVSTAALAQSSSVSGLADPGQYLLTVSDDRGDRAAALVNRLCDAYVAGIKALELSARTEETTAVELKITALLKSVATLEAVPPSQRSKSDQVLLVAQKDAIVTDQQILANALSAPANNVDVVTLSTGAARLDTRSLNRNLVVAGVAALLACFLIVLISEIARESRASAPPTP